MAFYRNRLNGLKIGISFPSNPVNSSLQIVLPAGHPPLQQSPADEQPQQGKRNQQNHNETHRLARGPCGVLLLTCRVGNMCVLA